ncbi:FMN-binding protein [Aeromicrobium wangtongii]|uniref:FMN-binding protein n=1 Tax=Aeromicrobium wangtongii TaxID=2969247 RepID=UPI0020173818|nr:FMN-binding protein [Aeromicrobium wangtongii]MCL3820352.1 FMN-binding protein [Aeromicrobium wangtongii]
MNLPAHKKMLSAAAAASVLLMTAACGSSESDGDSTSTSSTPSSPAPTTDAPADTAETPDAGNEEAGYADGSYEAEGTYVNPGGQSTVKVDLTLSGGKISDVTVTPEATDPKSKQFQTKFAGGVAKEVVGKSLDDLDVQKVAGSSLTSKGFNEAIESIKGEAGV